MHFIFDLSRYASNWRLYVVVLLAAYLCGCAATGDRFTKFRAPTSDSAEIVIYRPDLFQASLATLSVTVDGADSGVLRNGGWISVAVKPGPRIVKIEQRRELFAKTASISITAQEGKVVILRVLPGGMTGLYAMPAAPIPTFGPWTLQEVPEEVGVSEMKELKQSN